MNDTSFRYFAKKRIALLKRGEFEKMLDADSSPAEDEWNKWVDSIIQSIDDGSMSSYELGEILALFDSTCPCCGR